MDAGGLEKKRTDDLLRLARQKLHAYPYKDVPLCWRRLFTDASIVKAAIMIQQFEEDNGNDELIVHTLDMALIMAGAPGKGRREIVEKLLDELNAAFSPPPPAKRQKMEEVRFDTTVAPPVEIQYPIPRHNNLSLGEFQRRLDTANTPIVITDTLSHWPALSTRPWSSPAYLLSLTNRGKRLVPVEVGRTYTDPSWGQKIISFSEFLCTYMSGSGGETGYLAQHNLFSQIPALRKDITIPDYCYSAPPPHPPNVASTPPLEEPMINAWLGPRGTVSPLHTDPYANVLAQVVGSKYIRLYAPEETERVFPRGIEEAGVDMGNTSRVEVEEEGGGEGLSEEERRVWKKAKYVETVLREGEVLFIPAGWWHYVRSLEVSFSVSFWWN